MGASEQDVAPHLRSSATVLAVDDAKGTTISCSRQARLFSDIFSVDITRFFEEEAIATYMFEFDLNKEPTETSQHEAKEEDEKKKKKNNKNQKNQKNHNNNNNKERLEPVRAGTILSVPKKQGVERPIEAVDESVKETFARAWVTVTRTKHGRIVAIESMVGSDKLELVEVIVPDNSWPYLREESKSKDSKKDESKTSKHHEMMDASNAISNRPHNNVDSENDRTQGKHPHDCHHMNQLKDTLYHYYRGANSKDYSEIRQLGEYVHAVLVGFVMPIVVLGVVFAVVALCVYACNYKNAESMTASPEVLDAKQSIDDEEEGSDEEPVSEKQRLLVESQQC